MTDRSGVPSYDALLWPVVQVLRTLGGSGTISEINERIVDQGGFMPEQQQVLYGDGPRTEIEYRLACTPLAAIDVAAPPAAVDAGGLGIMAMRTAAWPGSAATPAAAEPAPDTALVYSLVRFDDGGAREVVEVFVAFESVSAADRCAADGRFGDYAVAPLVFAGLRPTDALR